MGIDSSLLAEFVDTVIREELPIHGVHVYHNDEDVLRVLFPPFSQAPESCPWSPPAPAKVDNVDGHLKLEFERHYSLCGDVLPPDDVEHGVADITQSVLGTLVGVALQRGDIKSIDQKVLDFFPAAKEAERDPRKLAMTIGDLVTQRSGLDCNEIRRDDFSAPAAKTSGVSWPDFVLSLIMGDQPGSVFRPCDSALTLLVGVLRAATGVSVRKYAEANLFKPLRMWGTKWELEDETADLRGRDGLVMTLWGMAQLGLLYLSEGVRLWQNGDPIIPRDWARAVFERRIPISASGFRNGFNNLWWNDSRGLAIAYGRGGQMILIAPAAGLVITMVGRAGDEKAERRKLELLERYILGAYRGRMLSSTIEKRLLLEKMIRSVATKKVAVQSQSIQLPLSNAYMYRLNSPVWRLDSFGLTLDMPNKIELTLYSHDTGLLPIHRLYFDSSGNWNQNSIRFRTMKGEYPGKSYVRLRTITASSIEIEIEEANPAMNERWLFHFEQDHVDLQITDSNSPTPINVVGHPMREEQTFDD